MVKDDGRGTWSDLPKPKETQKHIKRRFRKLETATVKHAHKFVIKRWDNVREVQRLVVLWILAIAFLIGATGLQLIWNQQNYQTTTSSLNGTYAEATLGPIDTLNPLFATSAAEQSASNLLFSSLLKYDRTGHLGYDLATEVKPNDKNTVYTVRLRSDVKWHDGVSLTADDVLFTVGLLKDPNTRAVDTGWSGVAAREVNKFTVEFTLQSTFAAFQHVMTFPVVPKHILGSVDPSNIRENSFSNNPVGTGPFKFNLIQDIDNANSGRKVVYLSRNDEYYGGTAKLLHFQLHAYNTTDEIINALSQNEVNAAVGLSPVDIARVNSSHYKTTIQPINGGVYAMLNTKSAILNDVGVRRALQLATDTASIRKGLAAGVPALGLPLLANQLTTAIPASPVFDQTAAKNLLDSSGWKVGNSGVPEKDGKQLKISAVALKGTEFEKVLETLVGQWRAVGVSVDTKVVDPTDTSQAVTQNILQPRNYDVLLYQLNLGADPDVYAYWHSSQNSMQGLNFSNYSNSIADDALLSARSRVEPALRNAKYVTFIKQWLADVPAIGLYQSTIQYVSSNDVKSFDKSNTLISPTDRYTDVLDWSVGTRKVFKTP